MIVFTNIFSAWKYMTKAEKIKTVVELVCDVGGGLIVSSLIPNYGSNPLTKGAIGLTKFGLGCALGDAASDQVNGLIDTFTTMKEANAGA